MQLCNPRDCSPPGFSVHEISQATILEWVAISFFRGSSGLRDQIHISCTDRILHPWTTWEGIDCLIINYISYKVFCRWSWLFHLSIWSWIFNSSFFGGCIKMLTPRTMEIYLLFSVYISIIVFAYSPPSNSTKVHIFIIKFNFFLKYIFTKLSTFHIILFQFFILWVIESCYLII